MTSERPQSCGLRRDTDAARLTTLLCELGEGILSFRARPSIARAQLERSLQIRPDLSSNGKEEPELNAMEERKGGLRGSRAILSPHHTLPRPLFSSPATAPPSSPLINGLPARNSTGRIQGLTIQVCFVVSLIPLFIPFYISTYLLFLLYSPAFVLFNPDMNFPFSIWKNSRV